MAFETKWYTFWDFNSYAGVATGKRVQNAEPKSRNIGISKRKNWYEKLKENRNIKIPEYQMHRSIIVEAKK